MTGLLPPSLLRERLGDLESLAVDAFAVAPAMLTRESPREYAALVNAMASSKRTPCANDDRFTVDSPTRLSSDDLNEMRSMCRSCDVRLQCDLYAAAARPAIGFWAGQQRPIAKEAAVA